MAHHGMMDLEGMTAFCTRAHQSNRGDRFGRMFPDLPASFTPAKVLKEVGKKGGDMDDKGSPEVTATVPAGMVIFGQFIDHDITLDVASSFETVNDAHQTPNTRTPTLDLDCIYGSGREPHAFLYQSGQGNPFDGAKLLTGADIEGANVCVQNDLWRSPAPFSRAVIGDFRNDENRVVSQMQLGMIRFHNLVAQDMHEESGKTLKTKDLYSAAREYTTWHYQWSVVNDFLVSMCGQAVVDDILCNGREYYCGSEPYIPIEFAVAAYRFGHAMVPMNVQIRRGGKSHPFFGKVLGSGFEPVPGKDAVVDWNELLDAPTSGQVQMADKLNTKMNALLLELPFVHSGENSLATRNMLRGNSFLLPGGDKLAAHMGRSKEEITKVMKGVSAASGGAIKQGAPLWLYLLAEAECIGRETVPGRFDAGEGLGPVGARIVAEVIIGLLEMDPHSYLGANRNWEPDEKYDSIGKILVAASGAQSDALYDEAAAAA